MTPQFMKFRQSGQYGQEVWINMNQICHIMAYGNDDSKFTFCAVLNHIEPAYLIIEGKPDDHLLRLSEITR